MDKIEIIKQDITSLQVDAIVNAANEMLIDAGGVCKAVFKAAGAQELKTACSKIGGCKTGSAVITPGFKLKAMYIIHAVGPHWLDGNHDEPALLNSAYKQALILAKEHGCKSIGFPLISAGSSGYPADKAWETAIQACLDFQKENPNNGLSIRFAVNNDKILDIGKKTLAELRKERTTAYLHLLDEKAMTRIRDRIRKETDLLIDKKAHPMAGGLLDVICDPGVINQLSTDQIIKVAEAIFPAQVLEEAWISKYIGILLRIVNESKQKNKNERADQYEKYMLDVLIPALNKGIRSGSVMDNLERLEDIYKTVVCLYRFHHNKEPLFVFDVDYESMENINKAIQNVIIAGGNVLGIKIDLGGIEDRQYATFLSWILEEMLAKQEGLEEGEE